MQTFCGRIRNVYIEDRIFEIYYKKRIYHFHLTRSQMKKFEPYLQDGLYVFFKAFDESKKYGRYMAYDVINFIKLVRHVGRKTIVYYDIQTIKEGVRKLLKKDGYRLFLDLEFTMPPYNYNHSSKEQFFSEIVQYGMYIEDSSGNIIDSSDGLIRPKCKLGISDRMLEFIHVSKEKLEHAPYYSKFYNKLRDYMMYYQPTIYVWGKNDYLMIDKSFKLHNVKPVTERKNYVNLMQIIKNYYGIKNDIGLYAAFELLGAKPPLEVQDHDALHDASATLEVFHLFENEINK